MAKFDIDKAKAGHPVLWEKEFPCKIHDYDFNGTILCCVDLGSQKAIQIAYYSDLDNFLSLAPIKKTAWIAINTNHAHMATKDECQEYINTRIHNFKNEWIPVQIEWEE